MKNSIKQRALDFAGNRSKGAGHGYPSFTARLIEKGYVQGAKDQQKLIFDWLFEMEYLSDDKDLL